jgi:hypothetical protein
LKLLLDRARAFVYYVCPAEERFTTFRIGHRGQFLVLPRIARRFVDTRPGSSADSAAE